MPDEFEAEAIARRVREDLEYQRFQAQDRVRQAERDAQKAKDEVEKNREAKQREADEAAAEANAAERGRDGFFEAAWAGGDTIVSGPLPELPPPDVEVADRAAAAEKAAADARAELQRIEEQIANLPPDEDILSEIDDVNPEWGGSEAAKNYAKDRQEAGAEPDKERRFWDNAPWTFGSGASCREIIGVITAIIGAGMLALGVQPELLGTTGGPGGAAPSPSSAAVATVAPTARPTSVPTAAPVTGTTIGLVDFEQSEGNCPTPRFQSGFQVSVNAGLLTLTQLGLNHVSTGTIDQDGRFETAGEGQSYRGMIRGSYIGGLYLQPDGCGYRFRGNMTQPILEPPPYGNAPGRLEFFNPQTGLGGLGLLDIAPGQRVHVIVGSNGDPDIRTYLPIMVRGTYGGQTFWNFAIEGDPTRVCRDATGCSADAPTPRDAAWDSDDQPLTIIATGRDGTVLAVHAPYGMAASAPGASASPVATAAPTAAPTPAPSGVTSPPPATTGGSNPLLIVLGLALMAGGLGFGFGPRFLGSGRISTVARDSRRDDAEAMEALAAKKEEEANELQSRYSSELAKEQAPVDFEEATRLFADVVNRREASAGSGAPTGWFESTKAKIDGLRAEAAQLREEAAKLRGQLDR